jgi:uncharacterized protein with von Willebrand factor type A (vWA) domain
MSYIFEAKSDAYYKSGLAKSAFHDSVYESLPLEYYLPFITSTQRTFFNLGKYHVKFYQAHDAFLMHYKPYSTVFQSLKKQNKIAPLWRLVVERALKNQKFLDLNKITVGSSELSIVASINFLQNLFRRINIDGLQQRYSDVLHPQAPQPQQGAQTLNKFMKGQDTQAQQQSQQTTSQQRQRFAELVKTVDEAVDDAVENALNLAVEYKESVEGSAEDAMVLGGAGGSNFVKEALSVIRFLSTPDWFRERVKILRYARQFYVRFLTAVPTSIIHEQIVSVHGGVNGVTRMFSEKQISDILPSELALAQLGDAGKALLALKIAQKQLMVYQRSASVKPVVFVDKSGSMAGSLTNWRGEEIAPKISIASGLALALHKKLDADIYLFDTEIEKVNPARIVDVLLKIRADGGTDIDPVLEEIMRVGKPEYTYIIISDGITEASDDILRRFEESGLAKRVKLILVPPSSYGFNWVEVLKKYGNMMYVHNVAEFDEAVKKSLTT